MTRICSLFVSLVALVLPSVTAAPDDPMPVTLSIVATTDLHGAAFPRNGGGGLPLLAGYVNNLRQVRTALGGSVLLIDSGDTFQGDIESNLSEGALVVAAYNAMGYTAQAIGNHDFDFGAVDSPAARQIPGDLRGALEARAAQAQYPFLAANLVDGRTGHPVDWPNVRPSVLVEAAGVKIGIVGVMTVDALQSTLAANVQGLRIAPLASTIATYAAKLRTAGADLIIVAAHAGGRCDRFDRPEDLSSCDGDAEIFRVARSLSPGLVDVIAAGHTHGALAHRVNGICLVQASSRGQAFGRVDVTINPRTRRVVRTEPFAPQPIVPGQYEGRMVVADPAIGRAMAPALERVHTVQAMPLGVSTDTPVRRIGTLGSPLGNVFAEALLDAVPGADVAAINNAARGLRADLSAGPVTVGRLYDVFPFDNRVMQLSLSGGTLRQWISGEIQQGRRGSLGIAGVDVRTACPAGGLQVDLFRGARAIRDDDRLVAVTIGGPTLSGNLASSDPVAGVGPVGNAPVVREVVEEWLRRLGPQAQRRLDDATHRAAAVDGQVIDCVAR